MSYKVAFVANMRKINIVKGLSKDFSISDQVTKEARKGVGSFNELITKLESPKRAVNTPRSKGNSKALAAARASISTAEEGRVTLCDKEAMMRP